MSSPFYNFEMKGIKGEPQKFDQFKGKVVLVVNVASKCGYTPQYKDLEALYQKYKDQGFVIIGFPCNQFAHQEPSDEAGIQEFCSRTYNVTFPLFSKISVNGDNTAPLYQWLKHEIPGIFGTEGIKWNFSKFLVGRDGRALKRYSSTDIGASLDKDVVKALNNQPVK